MLVAKEKKGIPCRCSSHKCKGTLLSKNTITKHAKEDICLMKQTSKSLLPRLDGCSYNPISYETNELALLNLYAGSEISVLDYIFIEFRKFVSHPSYAKRSVTENFRSDKEFKLPKPDLCPSSFDNAKGLVKDFLVPIQTYDVCQNDCVVFRKSLEHSTFCPKCNLSRFKSDGKPRKIFKYLPLSPRLARIYQNENLVALLQSHVSRPDDGYLHDILDTPRWKNDWFGSDEEFDGLMPGSVLNFCTDGVNPFKAINTVYSMWPMMVSLLNFPISFRKSVGGILLLGIIPGNGRKEAYNIDPYLQILIDELLVPSDCDVYYPSYMTAPVSIKAKLLQFVFDFPAIVKLMKQPGAGGYMACPWYQISGIYCRSLSKTVYLSGRRYLCAAHSLRRSKYFRIAEKSEAPKPLNLEDEKALRIKYDDTMKAIKKNLPGKMASKAVTH